jgi:RNA polymerase sigma-70 factor (ECF subfamily)
VSLRVGTKSDAEDITSDIFTKVLENITSFRWRKGISFSSWVFRIAHNAVIDYYRTKREWDSVEELPALPADSASPQEIAEGKELAEELQSMVRKLPQSQAEVIIMRFFTGMKNKEIAQALNISEKTVASNLCRGLKNLRDQYWQRSSNFDVSSL